MTRINIPYQVFPGFKLISEFNSNQMESLIATISVLPIDVEYVEVASKFDDQLEVNTGRDLLQTLLSFNSLLEENEDGNDILAKRLADAFIYLSKEELSTIKINSLEENLKSILNNYSRLSSIINTRKTLRLNGNNITEFNINSDIRLLFNEGEDINKRSAIIFHKMQFEYTKYESLKEITFTVDVDDLKKIKIEIEKAIKNDRLEMSIKMYYK